MVQNLLPSLSPLSQQATLDHNPIAQAHMYHAWEPQSASPRVSFVMAKRTVLMVLMKDHAFRAVPMMVVNISKAFQKIS